jgi:alpha 1,3-glucosidase
MLSTALVAYPFAGEDIGGHLGDATAELITRWFQDAAWIYAFFREHSCDNSAYREPYVWPEPTYHRIVNAIYERYMFTALWYTHGMYSLKNSRAPVVPLFYEWPEIASLHMNDHQALVGDAILVTPVTHPETQLMGAKVFVEKPPGNWYSLYNGTVFNRSGEVPVDMESIPLYLRGGRIVPMYEKPLRNTIETIVTDMTLLIGVGEDGRAEGWLYLDDGITFNYTLGVFVHRKIVYEKGRVSWSKAEAEAEKKVPDFLKSARVTKFKIYDHGQVNVVDKLEFRVVDEWEWPRRSGQKGLKFWQIGVIAGGAALVIGIAIAVSVVLLRRRRGFWLDARLLTVPSSN